jgi:hypothetical protein
MEELDNLQRVTQRFHSANLESKQEKGKKVGIKDLINILNYINFQGSPILVNLKHLKYNNVISLPAKPQPCLENTLDCLWFQKTGLTQKLSSYQFLNFILNDGLKTIVVEAEVKKISDEGISFILPEICYDVSSREVRRHPCEGIQVELLQSGIIFHGFLLDFSAVSFAVKVSVSPPQTFQWLNPEYEVNVIFKNGQDIFYSGECMIIRQTYSQKTRIFALKPLNNHIYRLRPKEFRSSRHKLSPSPNIIFRHPLTRKMITLEADDISGTGFSVEEYYENSVLLPGMNIPELYLVIANDFKIKCWVQVVYKDIYETTEGKKCVRCGMVILDMDIQDQVRLSALLHQVTDRKSYVCNSVDLDDLWKLFFEAGFIYPKKYAFIYNNREKFKETYEKLYIQSPSIARHFIYQDKGIIHGHISMVRSYENTWLFHHHAASRTGQGRAGLIVLNQIGRYVNDFYCLYSTHMNFVICYFRPENRFPNRVFGGFTRALNEPKVCSIDPFAYFHFLPKVFEPQDLPGSWTLSKTQPEDFLELESFYEHESGGLMLHALNIEQDMIESDNLNEEYQRLGFKRERHFFSLTGNGCLKAIFMVTLSDIGLNLSNLTNCIHALVIDSDDLSQHILYASLSQLSQYYEEDEITILLYPVSFAETQSLVCEKIYNLWAINTQYTDRYLKYMENLLNHTKHE